MSAETIKIESERLSSEFIKHHLRDLPFYGVIHHFTGIDKGSPHDHPFDFKSTVLYGGYVERVYRIDPDGSWSSELIARRPGETHEVRATDIHQIVELPTGQCYTIIVLGPKVREWRFWKFTETGSESRDWREGDFQ